jgi:hypothetical protein
LTLVLPVCFAKIESVIFPSVKSIHLQPSSQLVVTGLPNSGYNQKESGSSEKSFIAYLQNHVVRSAYSNGILKKYVFQFSPSSN